MSQLAPETTVGAVHLTVADLDRSVGYYERALGLQEHERDGGVARLGAGGDDLLVLYEEPGARPVAGHTGLFHFAILLPDRIALARWLRHVAENQIELTGASDHLVSEAIYLRDPDGHGIEVYRDRPRADWPRSDDGAIKMDTLPLDTDDLLGALRDEDIPRFEQAPPRTVMGHTHLHVRDVAETEDFYAGTLGFDVMARFADQATFMSAGGYHHHLGANIWAGAGATPPPSGAAALRFAEIVVPTTAERDRLAGLVADTGQEPEQHDGGVLVRDPSQNGLLLRSQRIG